MLRRILSASLFISILVSMQTSFAEDREIIIKPGQSLMKIMRSQYPGKRNQWPKLMREIVETNPEAFDNGNPSTLKVGSTIVLPGGSQQVQQKKQQRIRAAVIQSVDGNVAIFDASKTPREMVTGEYVYVGDQLITGESDYLKLKMIDGASIELFCNSVLNINNYRLRSRGSNANLALVKGMMHTETGRIGKLSNDEYIVTTPLSSVKAHDAEYGVRVHQQTGCEAKADVDDNGQYVEVVAGEVTLKNRGGSMQLASGKTAYIPDSKSSPESYQAFAGMIYGKPIPKPVIVEVEEEKPAEKEEQPDNEDGVPWWWIISGVLMLGLVI